MCIRDSLEAADLVAMTPAQDTSWCHTIGYLSPMVAGAVIAGVVANKPVDANALRSHLEECLSVRPHAAEIAANLKGIERLIVVGGGYDRISADELVLKVEEGLHLPSAVSRSGFLTMVVRTPRNSHSKPPARVVPQQH